MTPRERWSRILLHAGYAVMLAGALDPLEGSLAILPGSALVALATFLEPNEGRWLRRRLLVFGMIAFGVAALFATSARGGFGGARGLSPWWAVLVVPYLAGWAVGILGAGTPRWVPWGALGIGLWYAGLATTLLVRGKLPHPNAVPTLSTLGGLGVAIALAAVCRLRRRSPAPPAT